MKGNVPSVPGFPNTLANVGSAGAAAAETQGLPITSATIFSIRNYTNLLRIGGFIENKLQCYAGGAC